MIKPYNGAKAAKFANREPLPRGGYVLKIISAKTEDYDWGQKLILAVDVCEGEHKGFFERDFKANTNEDKKWRGTYRINVPNEGGQYFETQQKSFNNFIACVEESNSGYHWDWDESKLKGKLIGGLWRNKEWEMNGKTVWIFCSGFLVKNVKRFNHLARFLTLLQKMLPKVRRNVV